MRVYRNKKDGWLVLRDILVSREEFKNTTESFIGIKRTTGWHGRGWLPESIEIPDDVDYVIYSYATPIAWHVPKVGWTIPDVIYSRTTSQHQNRVRVAVTNA